MPDHTGKGPCGSHRGLSRNPASPTRDADGVGGAGVPLGCLYRSVMAQMPMLPPCVSFNPQAVEMRTREHPLAWADGTSKQVHTGWSSYGIAHTSRYVGMHRQGEHGRRDAWRPSQACEVSPLRGVTRPFFDEPVEGVLVAPIMLADGPYEADGPRLLVLLAPSRPLQTPDGEEGATCATCARDPRPSAPAADEMVQESQEDGAVYLKGAFCGHDGGHMSTSLRSAAPLARRAESEVRTCHPVLLVVTVVLST